MAGRRELIDVHLRVWMLQIVYCFSQTIGHRLVREYFTHSYSVVYKNLYLLLVLHEYISLT